MKTHLLSVTIWLVFLMPLLGEIGDAFRWSADDRIDDVADSKGRPELICFGASMNLNPRMRVFMKFHWSPAGWNGDKTSGFGNDWWFGLFESTLRSGQGDRMEFLTPGGASIQLEANAEGVFCSVNQRIQHYKASLIDEETQRYRVTHDEGLELIYEAGVLLELTIPGNEKHPKETFEVLLPQNGKDGGYRQKETGEWLIKYQLRSFEGNQSNPIAVISWDDGEIEVHMTQSETGRGDLISEVLLNGETVGRFEYSSSEIGIGEIDFLKVKHGVENRSTIGFRESDGKITSIGGDRVYIPEVLPEGLKAEALRIDQQHGWRYWAKGPEHLSRIVARQSEDDVAYKIYRKTYGRMIRVVKVERIEGSLIGIDHNSRTFTMLLGHDRNVVYEADYDVRGGRLIGEIGKNPEAHKWDGF